MADINPLNTNYYYAGVQQSSSEVNKERKTEKAENLKKSNFRKFLKIAEEENAAPQVDEVAEKIANLSIEDAAVYLKDQVDIWGDRLAESPSDENIAQFKKSVKDFINFVTEKNFVVTAKQRRGIAPGVNYFSNYQLPMHKKNPRVQIEVISKKLDEFARITLKNQRDNLIMLGKINEIKGLIVDFMSS